MDVAKMDAKIIRAAHELFEPLSRGVIFIVYAWFGALKLFHVSGAEPMVLDLFNRTVPIMSFTVFYPAFALFEILIGVLFLFPKFTRVVIPLLLLHLILTALPLFLLPHVAWAGFAVPTLAGQYMIKNLAIAACALGIAGHVHSRRLS
jgi:hypothetical protein